MAYDYPVTLDLEGQPCLLAGSGPLAIDRLTGFLRSRADLVVVTPSPSPGLAAQCEAFGVPLLLRPVEVGDLAGCRLAIVTREDDCDVEALHAAAREHGVLFAALDDIAHCDFGAVSQVQRGSLTVTISSAGRAPAVAKRVRKKLEATLPVELAQLVEVVVRAKAAHGPRDVPFPEWSSRWDTAMADLDGMLDALAEGRHDEVQAAILATISGAVPVE